MIGQRQASPHTIASYRDAFRLLVRTPRRPVESRRPGWTFDDLDAATISGFLTHLERDRGVGVATRNARLTAVRSPVHLRRAAPPRARRADRPGARDPRQTR